MDVSTDGFSKLLLKSSLLLCTYFTWLLCGTRKPPRGVICSQGGDSTFGAPSGVLGVAHRAVLAQGWRCKSQGCPCRHIAELQVIGKLGFWKQHHCLLVPLFPCFCSV